MARGTGPGWTDLPCLRPGLALAVRPFPDAFPEALPEVLPEVLLAEVRLALEPRPDERPDDVRAPEDERAPVELGTSDVVGAGRREGRADVREAME